jgi:hypothetical protein
MLQCRNPKKILELNKAKVTILMCGPGLRDGRLLLVGEEMGTGPPPAHRIDGRRSKVQGAKDESCSFRLPC